MAAPPVDRVKAVLDRAAPESAALSTQEVAEAALACLDVLDPTGEAAEKELSDRTIRYYQQRGIVTPPAGRTSTARYGRRQVLETVVVRLANVHDREPLDSIADRASESTDRELLEWAASVLPEPAAEPSQPRTPSGGLRASRVSQRVRVELAAGVFLDVPADHPVLDRADLPALVDAWAGQLLE